MDDYKITVGIEIHCELKTNTKMFSSSLNKVAPVPNLNINEVDFAYPGTLPTINKGAVALALRASLVLNCNINKVMTFDRKNYFYPDLPKGYQITQARSPIGVNGYIEIDKDKIVRIHDVHIEEDTAKSIHHNNKSLLDFNRCGVPLIEIVSEADMHGSSDAIKYVEALREVLLYTDVTDAKIEEGSMRCDVNVSVSKTDVLGTRTEIKNVGSISSVGRAIEAEARRQIEVLEHSGVIREETRRFDEEKNETILMRVKETGNDYRYFPEPDLPRLVIDDEFIDNVKNTICVLPNERRKIYVQNGISELNANKLIQNRDLSDFLLNLNGINYVIASNLLLGDISSYLNRTNKRVNETKLTKEKFVELVNMLNDNTITNKVFKDILDNIMEEELSIKETIEKLGIKSIDDEESLKEIIKSVINNNPESVKDYKEGHDRALKFLMGQVMKETKGSANPKIASEILIKTLNNN